MLFFRARSIGGAALRAAQCGDEVVIPEVPQPWARRLAAHLAAAGFDGRCGGPIGLEELPSGGAATLHIHNASVRTVRQVVTAFVAVDPPPEGPRA